MKTIILSLLFLIPVNYNIFTLENKKLHPVHISFTTIEYFEKENQYKILFKLFVDDFNLILNKKYDKNIQLSEKDWKKSYVKTINSYIKNNFQITDANNKSINLKFDNHEFKEQAIYLYYKSEHKTNSGKFRILNKIMLDLYPDQKNLLILVFKGKTKALQFNRKNIKEEIVF